MTPATIMQSSLTSGDEPSHVVARLQRSAGGALLTMQSWSSHCFGDGLEDLSSFSQVDDRDRSMWVHLLVYLGRVWLCDWRASFCGIWSSLMWDQGQWRRWLCGPVSLSMCNWLTQVYLEMPIKMIHVWLCLCVISCLLIVERLDQEPWLGDT